MELLEQLYKKSTTRDLSALTKEQLLTLIQQDLSAIDKSTLEDVLYKTRTKEYKEAYTQHIEQTAPVIDLLLQLTQDFKISKSKHAVLKQIVAILQSQDTILISKQLPHQLVEPILYALDSQDLQSAATLMQKRIKMEYNGGLYAGIMYRHPDRVDRMELLDKFVGVVAQQCDKQTADRYLKELGEGKYTSLMRIIDGRYYYVGEDYIKQMYMQAKQPETQDQPEM